MWGRPRMSFGMIFTHTAVGDQWLTPATNRASYGFELYIFLSCWRTITNAHERHVGGGSGITATLRAALTLGALALV